MKKIVLFIVLFVSASQAQIRIHKTLTLRDGLAQSHIFSLLKDQQGHLWVGTYDGVSRWNGFEFANFNTSDGLASSLVLSLYQAKDGRLYIGGDKGVTLYDGKTFQSYELSDCYVTCICQDEQGNFYFATRDDGLYIHTKTNHVRLCAENGFGTNRINSLAFLPGWGVAVATDQGVWIVGSSLTPEIKLTDEDVTCLCYRDGTLLVGAKNKGLLRYKDETWDTVSDDPRLMRIRDICMDDRGEIYVAAMGGGVMHFDGQWHTLNTENGLAHDAVFCLLASDDGNTFFGTAGGLCIYQPSRLEIFSKDSGLDTDYILSICQRENGELLVGTFGGGIYHFVDSRWQPYMPEAGLRSQSVFYMAQLNDAFWFSTLKGLYSVEGNRVRMILPVEQGSNNVVTSFVSTGKDSMLIGSEKGFYLYLNGRISKLDTLQSVVVNTLEKGKDGNIYAGLTKGVLRYRAGKFSEFSPDSLLSESDVKAVYQHSDGRLFFATDHGLCIWGGDHTVWVRSTDGLKYEQINGVCQDQQGRLYLTSYYGVQILRSCHLPVRPRSLDFREGFFSTELSANAILCDNNGDIWMGSIKGLARYNPFQDRLPKTPPTMRLESVALFDEKIDLSQLESGEIELDYRHNYLQINYLGLFLGCPEKITYRVRLLGSDNTWFETAERQITFAHLLDGRYRFEVQARTEWSEWSEAKSLSFNVVPPFWKLWWVIAIAIIGLISLVSIPIYLRMRALLMVERFRGQIAADLHDNMGAGLTEISILSEVAGKVMANDFNKAREHLKTISESARNLIDTMSDTVWLVNPKHDTLYDLMLRLRDYYAEILSASEIALRLENLESLKNVHLPMEHRQQLYLVFKEAIHNSIKHSCCHNLTLKAVSDNKQLSILLFDDGTGLMSSPDSLGNGLQNMKRRANAIGGSLSVSNGPQGGAIIEYSGAPQ